MQNKNHAESKHYAVAAEIFGPSDQKRITERNPFLQKEKILSSRLKLLAKQWKSSLKKMRKTICNCLVYKCKISYT